MDIKQFGSLESLAAEKDQCSIGKLFSSFVYVTQLADEISASNVRQRMLLLTCCLTAGKGGSAGGPAHMSVKGQLASCSITACARKRL